MKKSMALLLLLCLCFAVLFVGGCGQQGESETGSNGDAAGDSQEPVELNFVSAYVDAHPTTVNAFNVWQKEVNEISGGLLTIHNFAPNTLTPERDVFDSTVNGFVDIGSQNCGFTPGFFNLTAVTELPLIAKSAESGSLVMMDLIEQYPEIKAEYDQAELLWMWVSATYNLHSVNKEVKTLEDLKGMRIIGWSPQVLEMIRLLGGNPMEIGAQDTYMSLERGMADAVLCPLAPVRSFKITDVAKHHTIIDLCVSPFFSVMNKDKYAALPDYAKEIIDETTGVEMARKCGLTLDEGAAADAQWMMDEGHTFYVIPDDERERWVDAVTPMWDKWVADREKEGFSNARDILNSAIELGKKYDAETGRGFVAQ